MSDPIPMNDAAPTDRWRSVVAGLRDAAGADIVRLVSIRSVSADPSAGPEIRRCADEVAALLRGAGLPDVEVLSVDGGNPVVLGRCPAPPDAPTVLLYAHYDVQPVGGRAHWDSDPFETVERDGRLFGRGAADDKAGIALHLTALRALASSAGPVAGRGVGVTVLVEGEEEIGSPTLPAFLERYGDRLAADVVVLADSTNWRTGVPALTTSLRGGVNAVVEVATLDHPVHNGLYGGPVPDALTVLARLLATLHDDRGDVAVPGLRRASIDGIDLEERRFRDDCGVLDGVRLVGSGSLATRLWSAPALSVIGIDAPPVESAGMNLVPTARAKVTLRIAPGDDAVRAREALVSHLEAAAPWGARVTVSAGKAVQPFAAATSGPAYDVARAAFADAWGVAPVEIGVGGSIDFIATFAAFFPHAEILITGVEDPDTRAHGPNESLHLEDFERACLAEVLLLDRLGRPSPSSRGRQ